MRAHLYGGANMHAGMQEIGSANARFAVDFLVRDKIPLTFSNLGGNSDRRVEYRAVKGQARCRVLADQLPAEIRLIPTPAAWVGAVELICQVETTMNVGTQVVQVDRRHSMRRLQSIERTEHGTDMAGAEGGVAAHDELQV